MTEDALDRIAQREREEARRRRRAHARRIFRKHAVIYLAVNAALVIAWFTGQFVLGGDGRMWFLPTLLGWGAALAVHRYAIRRAYQGPTPLGYNGVIGGSGG